MKKYYIDPLDEGEAHGCNARSFTVLNAVCCHDKNKYTEELVRSIDVVHDTFILERYAEVENAYKFYKEKSDRLAIELEKFKKELSDIIKTMGRK